ncbi:BofC C-terminal domain-containing protein [Aneurinibacillus terranovensis]|uniref:BofC C-terminal domain-containing protein n=1 Tax=Aneurinibacillus terranovensis TaxID=278991 RepID=UPI0006848B99|nr:BofC C-terminal domain-containing protein [Aneurinibacillus terranovensis]
MTVSKHRRYRVKHVVFLLVMVSFLIGGVAGGTSYFYRSVEWLKGAADRQVSAQTIHVILKRNYLSGDTTRENRQEIVNSSSEILRKYHSWNFISQQGNQFVFEMKVNDISPACKKNGYFGINDNGMLALYNGEPEKRKVMQTFFPLDAQKLESSLPQDELLRLKNGIRISNVAEYNSILSTYSEFANDEKNESNPK